jgi:hypothetical protein
MYQTSIFICGLSILALTSVEGYNGYVVFVWVYGIFLGNTSSAYNFIIPLVTFVHFFAHFFHLSLSIPFYPIPFLLSVCSSFVRILTIFLLQSIPDQLFPLPVLEF